MIFIVEFADGTESQISASIARDARALAASKFKDRLVMTVRPAGLFEMGYRRKPGPAPKVFN